ncbi:MAG: rod shape-determining protein RodA [Kiritimatiellia bacterium]
MIARMRLLLSRMDWAGLLATVALLVTGVFFIFSAGHAQGPTGQTLYLRQLVWAGLGMFCFLAFALTDYHHWYRWAWWLYLAALLLLLLVFVPGIGVRMYGARRWIQLAGIRLLQPAEMAKLALIIILARVYGAPGVWPRSRWLLVLALMLTALPVMMVAAQPDLGTASVFVPVLASILLTAGVPVRSLSGLAALAGLLLALLLILLLAPPALGWSEERHDGLLRSCGISSYQQDRIMVFLRRDADPLGAGWNKAQSQIAVGSGRLWGKGFRRGTQNILGFLPRTVAPNDFIFSVIAEEKGFMGALGIIILFAVVLHGAFRAALQAPDRIGRLLCVGVAALIFCHVFVNIAMTIGLLPITGLPLPLLSYGGTFMISVMIALGLVQSVYIRGERN